MLDTDSMEIFKPDGSPPIIFSKGSFEFADFERIKEEAINLSRELQFSEVTEDNIQVNKKLVASVRKRLTELSKVMKDAKTEYLKPYEEVMTQVNEINMLVQESENTVRERISSIEDNQRLEKLGKIHELWDKRMKHSEINLLDFDDFIQARHMNKTQSLDKTEVEMVEYISTKQNEITTILSMENRDQILPEYIQSWNLQEAIRIVTQRIKIQQSIKDIPQTNKTVSAQTTPIEDNFTFNIKGKDNIDKVTNFLNENNIPFN